MSRSNQSARVTIFSVLVAAFALASACKSNDKASPSAGSPTKDESSAPAEVDTTPSAKPQPKALWLTRGGSINRASTMEEWSAAEEEERLASAADLVSMSMMKANKPVPPVAEFEQLARALEKELSAKNADGGRNKENVGAIFDEVWPSIAP